MGWRPKPKTQRAENFHADRHPLPGGDLVNRLYRAKIKICFATRMKWKVVFCPRSRTFSYVNLKSGAITLILLIWVRYYITIDVRILMRWWVMRRYTLHTRILSKYKYLTVIIRTYTCSGFCKTSYHSLISPPPTNLSNTLKIHTGKNKIDR